MWPTRSSFQIWSHLLKKSLMENFIFCAVFIPGLTRVYCNSLIKIASCFKQGNNSTNVFFLWHSSSWWYIFDKSPAYERNKQCFKIIMFHKLWVANRWVTPLNLIFSIRISCKSIYISVKNHYGSQTNYQLSKTCKWATAFWLNNTDFPALASLSLRKSVSGFISVSPYKSVHNSLIKPIQKPSYLSFVKPVSVVVCKCSFYNSSPWC